ncbi:MAG: hypothetical protein IJ898_02890 [Prevotella sp.]|nr:hypothetical protein [Prevotella sp.]
MKKSIILRVCAALILTIGMNSCSSESDGSRFQVRNFANTGCKSTGTRGDILYNEFHKEYIEYESMTNGYLSLNHVNVRFNCEPGQLQMQATIESNVIKIVESEEQVGANCVCPYDLYCEVGPLSDGEYTVVVYQDDTFDQVEPGEYVRFNISYKNGLSGKLDIKEWYW